MKSIKEELPEYMMDVNLGDIAKFEEDSKVLSELCRKAIKVFGSDIQYTIAMEELSELITEIARKKRGTGNIDNLMEELVDADIMLVQLKEDLFNKGYVNQYIAMFSRKLEHLDRIIKEKESKDNLNGLRRDLWGSCLEGCFSE